ncbi:MAG: hypothetical protein K2I23_02680, partial [Clostridia bacterium]|nr:hypothetical protein [Clostridia bacterium]
MNFSNKKLISRVCIVLILTIAMLLSCLVIISGGRKTADAFLNTTAASQSSNLGELMVNGYENSADEVFNEDVFWNLVTLVTGVSNPTNATLNSWNTKRTASQFREANSANDKIDLSLTINGLSWTPVYLSYNNDNEPILTLWLSFNSNGSIRWNEQANDSVGKYPNNMYGTSKIRAIDLNNGGGYAATYNAEVLTPVDQNNKSKWAIYTMPNSTESGKELKGSLTEFIEVPDNMSWQHDQKALDYVTASRYAYKYNNNNDALDYGGNAPIGSYTDTSASSANNVIDQDGYRGWAKDKLWLPSVAETGVDGEDGMWLISANQRECGAYAWLRSAYYNNYSWALLIDRTYASDINVNYNGFSLRPAFHLNLKKVANTFMTQPPSDVECFYNGKELNIDDVSDKQKTWYDEGVMDLFYPNGKTNVGPNVGTYTVTAMIKSDLAADGLEFAGNPDANKGETATKRVFNFIIKPKPLTISWTDNVGDISVPSLDDAEICSNESNVKDTVTMTLEYTGTLTATGQAYTDTTKKPKKAGNYFVEVTALSNNNYKIADNADTKHSFTLDILNLDKPTFVEKEWHGYNGKPQTYTIDHNSYDTEDMEITVPTEFLTPNKLIDFNPTFNLITVTEGGDFYLWLTIRDKENARWGEDGTTEDKKLEFKILPCEVEIDLNDKDDVLSCTVGEDVDLLIEVGEIMENHKIVVDITATFNGASFTVLSGLEFDEDSWNDGLTETLPASLFPATGDYVLTMTLKEGVEDNRNFSIKCNQVTLTVEEEGSDSGKDVWRITKSTGKYHGNKQREELGTQIVNWRGSSITYDGKTTYGIEFKSGTEGLVVEDYNSDGYIHGYKTVGANHPDSALADIGKNADNYTTTVRVVDHNNNNDIVYYTITWSIAPYKFNLSDVTWENVKDGVSQYEYIGESQSPRLKDLPSELKLNLTGLDTSATNVGKYS